MYSRPVEGSLTALYSRLSVPSLCRRFLDHESPFCPPSSITPPLITFAASLTHSSDSSLPSHLRVELNDVSLHGKDRAMHLWLYKLAHMR